MAEKLTNYMQRSQLLIGLAFIANVLGCYDERAASSANGRNNVHTSSRHDSVETIRSIIRGSWASVDGWQGYNSNLEINDSSMTVFENGISAVQGLYKLGADSTVMFAGDTIKFLQLSDSGFTLVPWPIRQRVAIAQFTSRVEYRRTTR